MNSKKAAIYHFTNMSSKRPSIYQKQLALLEQYALSHNFSVEEIFCDKSLQRNSRTEFDRFLAEKNRFDVLIVKDFYHISKTTQMCIHTMKQLLDSHVMVHSLENGIFAPEEAPFYKPLKVALYNSAFQSQNEGLRLFSVHNDILRLFCRAKTNWIIMDSYFDVCTQERTKSLIQLVDLINHRDLYDLVVVHNLNDIHWRTTGFCSVREQLQLDIYSLQDGFFKYQRKEE